MTDPESGPARPEVAAADFRPCAEVAPLGTCPRRPAGHESPVILSAAARKPAPTASPALIEAHIAGQIPTSGISPGGQQPRVRAKTGKYQPM